MGIQDRDWYHEHRDKLAAADRARHRRQPPKNPAFGIWKQLGLTLLICLAVLGALFLVVVARAHWLR